MEARVMEGRKVSERREGEKCLACRGLDAYPPILVNSGDQTAN